MIHENVNYMYLGISFILGNIIQLYNIECIECIPFYFTSKGKRTVNC